MLWCLTFIGTEGKVKFGDNATATRWIKRSKERLFANKASLIITDLKRMKVEGATETERDKLSNYLSNNLSKIHYGKARRGGYPIGSGAIEIANKFIGHVRLKRSGAWWKINLANNILKLRCPLCQV